MEQTADLILIKKIKTSRWDASKHHISSVLWKQIPANLLDDDEKTTNNSDGNIKK